MSRRFVEEEPMDFWAPNKNFRFVDTNNQSESTEEKQSQPTNTNDGNTTIDAMSTSNSNDRRSPDPMDVSMDSPPCFRFTATTNSNKTVDALGETNTSAIEVSFGVSKLRCKHPSPTNQRRQLREGSNQEMP